MQYICIIDRVEEVNEYQIIGYLHNEGANPQAPYYEDMYTQELDTGADTFQFSTISNSYTQDLLEVGKYVGFMYNGKFQLFAITSLEYSHNEGYKTIGVYAEGIGFELLEVYMERPEITENGGNDSDNDGDDNTDDEYGDPDDVYIDADGNIIYIKYDNGEEPSADDVTIDGDGNIIYKPSRNKKNDSLELKNISYPTFLKLLLKDTNWEIICQPGLSSNKQNMSIRYDTNIYAILQDSMQTYQGVELEFVFESNSDNNGEAVRKVIKAYNNGGRGSFVGKRFEYGTNVRGITKTQKVANSEDDTILYIDDVGIEVYYDIDFALKSIEVPEIEIGDTHYVIDNTFYPPMTIKARIGKIEVSFSDPTRNKIYLANNKKIRGSVSDDIDEKAIKNIIDDNTINPEDYQDDMEIIEAGLGCIFEETVSDEGDIYYYTDNTIGIGQDLIVSKRIKGPDRGEGQYNFVTFEDGIKVTHIVCPEHDENQVIFFGANTAMHNSLTIFDDLDVEGNVEVLGHVKATSFPTWSDESMKENIRYIDASAMPTTYSNNNPAVYKENLDTRDYSSEDLLEKADLYDFIVNQVNICEYNYIGHTDKKIGFIANEYEGSKVGDKIVFLQEFTKRDKETAKVVEFKELFAYDTSNLLFATIGALQEEVRIRDEEIANLKNRLEKIEALLDINDNE